MGERQMRLTNTHQHQESSQETPEISHRVARAVHKIIGIGTSSADPIGQRSNNVSRNDSQRKVVVPDGRGKDNKEETDGQDLRQQKYSATEQGSNQISRGTTYKRKTNNGLETCRHDCGVVVVVGKGICLRQQS